MNEEAVMAMMSGTVITMTYMIIKVNNLNKRGYSPIIWHITVLDLDLVSKSTSTICCQVPHVRFLLMNGTVSEGPRSVARTWA